MVTYSSIVAFIRSRISAPLSLLDFVSFSTFYAYFEFYQAMRSRLPRRVMMQSSKRARLRRINVHVSATAAYVVVTCKVSLVHVGLVAPTLSAAMPVQCEY